MNYDPVEHLYFIREKELEKSLYGIEFAEKIRKKLMYMFSNFRNFKILDEE